MLDRLFMSIHTRYIIKNLLSPLLIITLALTFIIWLVRSMRFLELIVNNGLPFWEFLYLSVLLVPLFLTIILPVALLIAVIQTYSKLSTDRELVILSAAGMNSVGLATPAIILAIIVTLFLQFLTIYVTPKAYEEFRNKQLDFKNNSSLLLLQDGVFNTPLKGLTFYIDSHDVNGNLYGILVHDRNRKNPVTLIAKEGKLSQTNSGIILDVMGGRQETEKEDGTADILFFDSYSMNMSTYKEDKGIRVKGPEEKTLGELFESDSKKDQKTIRDEITEAHYRITWPMLSLTFTFLALIPFLTTYFRRSGNGRHIIIISCLSVLIVSSSLIIKYLSTSNASLVFLMYLNVLFPILIAFYIFKKNDTILS